MATTRWRPEMWLRPKRVEVLPCQSLLLHAHCAPLRITTRTVIESVKSTWTRDDFSINRFIWFGFAKQALQKRTPYLIADPDY